LNDLWAYKVENNQWSWIAGAPIVNPSGFLGDRNVWMPKASPKPRYGAGLVYDPVINMLYMFGGGSMKGTTLNVLNVLSHYDLFLGSLEI
jgi:hypothetical protein